MIPLDDCQHCGLPIYTEYIEAGEHEHLFHRECWEFLDEDNRYGKG